MYTKTYTLRIISAREFRGKQKDYLDLAEKEPVIIHRGKNKKSVLLTPIDENTETDIFFANPQILNATNEGIEDVNSGRVTSLRDLKNIWADIL
ncbi:type II toxin-antitoxin system Phd/YefM family antitoxin [Dyadobacter sp. LJ53]|uniref:type II toxin-antitoxin system Phd/YefM family antitoxin n=1 Tax=Dyadobacter chenwenxiniae TaxID=2906456 RepID=UPI001F2D99B6|nr:type II toxin-antitoxin system Phd/YefM family antitoxin [Dyadobacter chenwenxiniae]MCF0049231.1 type II toxin-antitoxin system Phd/YefM family antitoxin [Dyadobacter chenwenxiniae]